MDMTTRRIAVHQKKPHQTGGAAGGGGGGGGKNQAADVSSSPKDGSGRTVVATRSTSTADVEDKCDDKVMEGNSSASHKPLEVTVTPPTCPPTQENSVVWQGPLDPPSGSEGVE